MERLLDDQFEQHCFRKLWVRCRTAAKEFRVKNVSDCVILRLAYHGGRNQLAVFYS
jgi:hypothetical protein